MAKVDVNRMKLNVSMMRYFGRVIRKYSVALSGKQWDMILCTLDSWIGEGKCVSIL